MSNDAANERFVLTVVDVFDITGRGTAVAGPIESGVLKTGDRVRVRRNTEIVATAIATVELINSRRMDPRSIALMLKEVDGLRPDAGDQIEGISESVRG
jgi:translation elongation factor EF-Tu-like GTPase